MGSLMLQSQLGVLENGLKDLKRSRLMGVQEFKDMYQAVEGHHRNLKLAHLTGQAKDLQVQAEQDTKFFNILIKMMSEIKQLKTAQQKDSLMKVHTWYKANKHTLHSGPHFGRVHLKKEASDVLKKATGDSRASTNTARATKASSKKNSEKEEIKPVTRLTSAEGLRKFFQSNTPSTQLTGADSPKPFVNLELPSNRDYVNEYLTNRFFMAGEMSGMGRLSSIETPSNRAYMNDQVPSNRTIAMEKFSYSPSLTDGPDIEDRRKVAEELKLQRLESSLSFIEEGDNASPHYSPQDEDGSVLSQRYIESLTAASHDQDFPDNRSDFDEDQSRRVEDDMDSQDNQRKLSRSQTPSASVRGAMSADDHDQSTNLSTFVPKKMIHPIASLVNPHAQLAAIEAERAEQQYIASRDSTNMSLRASPSGKTTLSQRSRSAMSKYRPMTSMSQKSEGMYSWQNYNKDTAFGQDILSNLNFVGRSGTAMDVRYSAHDHGEMPERDTPQVLAFFCENADTTPIAQVITPRSKYAEEAYTGNSLEEFYKLTDGYYPPKLPKYHRPIIKKPRSAPTRHKEKVDKATKGTQQKFQPLGKHLVDTKKSDGKKDEQENEKSNVKLDEVVNMIDSVSEEMTYHKERVAPPATPGFRQPTSNSVPIWPMSRPGTAPGPRSPSPMLQANTPSTMYCDPRQRSHNQDLRLSLPDDPENLPPASSLSLNSSRTNTAIDWRGKIVPESERYKWQRTKFGGHTYVKKLVMGRRPVGATHAGKRPKTAPVTVREKWKTEKPNEQNVRVASQAATNTMMQVDQRTVDSLVMIQPIDSWNLGAGSMSSIFLDEDLFRSLNINRYTPGGSTLTGTPQPMEYVPIVSAAPKSVTDSRSQSRQTRQTEQSDSRQEQHFGVQDEFRYYYPDEPVTSEDQEENVNVNEAVSKGESDLVTGDVSAGENTVTKESGVDESPDNLQNQPQDNTDQRQTTDQHQATDQHQEADQNHDTEQQQEEQGEDSDEESVDTSPLYIRPPVQFHTEDKHNGTVHIEITAVPPGGRNPTPTQNRLGPVQHLSKSDTWNFSPDVEVQDIDSEKYLENIPRNKAAIKQENYCFDCLPFSMSTKVGRSAGRMPPRTQSATSQMLRMARRQNEYFKKAPPIRTPPSIPSPYHQSVQTGTPRLGETYNSGLEHHARRVKSPRHFMEQVVELRKDTQSAPSGSLVSRENSLMGSLHVCRLSTRGSTTEALEDGRLSPTYRERRYQRDPAFDGSRRVIFQESDENSSELGDNAERKSFTSSGTKYTAVSNQSIAHIGRPIAHFKVVHDPIEEAAAVRTSVEAKAAVDIQRIFRGYVARNIYKKLLKEEREKQEDLQKAAVEIQRRFRGHLIRKKKIYSQTGLSEDQVDWAKEYKQLLSEKNADRQRKSFVRAETNTQNFQKSTAKLSVIGPHVEIYQIYHPKQTGPTKRELSSAAINIQKHIRGFLIRKRFEKLNRKAHWYGSSFQKMVRDYKNMLRKCQIRHGKDRPKTPFTLEEMNEYLDMRKRYESVFEKKAFGGELELNELEAFFRECDLYPSAMEIEDAMDTVFNRQQLKRGLLKSEVLELIFYIYVPRATGLPNMRQSTWLNPIIDGVEAKKLIGSEYVEKAPLDVCANLVITSRRERKEKERREKDKKEMEELAQQKAMRKAAGGKDDDDSD